MSFSEDLLELRLNAESDSENEDDIGALGSILSWDEEDEEDGQAVNREAAAMNAALRERDNAPGTSAPPDMVQFSVKDGVPQFNFLSNNVLLNSGSTTPQPPQQNAEGNSSITLQLPMPTPISKFESYPQQQQQPQQQSKESNNDPTLQTTNNTSVAAAAATASVKQQQQPQQTTVSQQQQQQQTQQSLAATFAQLLARQAGTLFQQTNNQAPQQQQQQQPQQQQQQQSQQTNQPNAQTAGQQQTAAQPPPPKPQQQPATQQQQSATTIQQQLQQLAQLQQSQTNAQQPVQQASQPQTQAQTQQPVQAQAPAASSQPAPGISVQPAQTQMPQLQIPFSTDPNTFLQQLQFAQFQHQLQMQAQQQQQSQAQPQQQGQNFVQNAAVAASVPGLQFPQQQQQTQATPLNPRPAREGPPPAKRAKKSKAPPKSAASKKSPPAPASASPLLAAASAVAKAGIVSASDTDCDGPAAKKAASSLSDGKSSQDSKKSSKTRDILDNPNLSADEKAQANRDRNREHARNTRLRKKAYLEKLKTTVEELCRERDTLVSERAGAASLLVEMHNTRTEVLMSFFALRSSNEKRRKLWSSILDESSFTCAMPVTPYRSFPASEVQVSKCQRTIMGIDGMMADTASLHVLFDSLVDKKRFPDAKIEFRYTLVTEESVVAGNQMMARWVMSTINATKCGALTEVAKQGMLCCKFNSSHKIIGLELMFDVMAFMLQLKQAAGSDSFSVIPNTVQTCQRTFDKPMVMTLAEPPYTIVQVNKLWEDLTGYSAEEVVGKKSCMILQGPNTDKGTLSKMMDDIRFKRPGSVHITNVKKTGKEFRHFLLSFPLSTDSRVTHYVALSNHVEEITQPAPAVQRQIPATPVAASAPPTMTLPNQPAAHSNTVPNGTAAAAPQIFVAAPAPMVFHPQPQPVGSNNFHVGSSGMLPPANVPAQAVIHPTLMNPMKK